MKGFALEGIVAILLGIFLLSALSPIIQEQIAIMVPSLDNFSRALLSLVMPLIIFLLVLLVLAYF